VLLTPDVHADTGQAPPLFAEQPGVLEFTGQLIVRPWTAAERVTRGELPADAELAAARAVVRLDGLVTNLIEQTNQYVVSLPAGYTEGTFAAELLATGDYRYVHPNWLCYPIAAPNDEYFGDQWHHAQISSEAAWDLWTGSDEIVVAHTDTGVDLDHPDLAASLVPGYNSASDLSQEDGGDVSGVHWHGTHVAGCGAAIGNNAVGVAGIGWNFKIMPIRVTNRGSGGATYEDLFQGAIWAAENGAKVVSASYSGVDHEGVEDVGAYIRSLGAIYMYAAGNSGSDLYWFDWEHVVVVGATTYDDEKSDFSSYGLAVDLFAPGSNIFSTYWDGGYTWASGTSMATPIASGAAALIWSYDLSLSADCVEEYLYESCDDLGDEGEDEFWGWGRVNVRAAVERVIGAQIEIVQQPAAIVTCAGASVELSVEAESGESLSYQWLKDGEEISGATAAALTIDRVGPDDAGAYSVRIEHACKQITSGEAIVSIGDAIKADSNLDGSVDFDDIDCFVAAIVSDVEWSECSGGAAGLAICANDINGDGEVSFDDIDGFVECIISGGCGD
jgi:subtilisin family serine protease